MDSKFSLALENDIIITQLHYKVVLDSLPPPPKAVSWCNYSRYVFTDNE